MVDFYSNKIEQIESCIIGCNGEVNLWELRELALSKGGFVTRELRQIVWPILTGASDEVVLRFNDPNCECLSNNNNERISVDNAVLEIIQRDVRRTVWPSLVHQQEEKKEEERDRQELVNIICHVLGGRISAVQQQPRLVRAGGGGGEEEELHYYQGFHDICSLIHRTLSSRITSCNDITSITSAAVISQLCQRHFRDAMRINFNKFVRGIQLAFWPLLSQVDPAMEVHMFQCHYSSFFQDTTTTTTTDHIETNESADRQQVVSCYYADKLITPVSIVSWTMTWFASQLGNFETAATRFMDAFMASHPIMPLYVAVAFISYKRNSILCCECDFASIHMQLVRLPRTCMEERMLLKRNKTNSSRRTTNSTIKGTADDNLLKMEEEECIDEFCQLILELAITYMKRFPPWHIIRLSKLYRAGLLYRNSNPKNILLFDHSEISMFDTPASWSISSKIHCYNNKRRSIVQQHGCEKITKLYLENDKPQFLLAKVASGYSKFSSSANATVRWRQVLLVLQTHPKRRRIIRLLLLYGAGLFLFAKISTIRLGIPNNIAIISFFVPHSWQRPTFRSYSSAVTNYDSNTAKSDELVYATQEEEEEDLSITTLTDPYVDREISIPDNKLGSLYYDKIADDFGIFLPGETITNPDAEEEDTTFNTSTYIDKEESKGTLTTLIKPYTFNGIEAITPTLPKDNFEEIQQRKEENILPMKWEAIMHSAAERDQMEEQTTEVIIDESPAYDCQKCQKESKEGSCDYSFEKQLHYRKENFGFIDGIMPAPTIPMQAKGMNEISNTEGSDLLESNKIPDPKFSLSSSTEEANPMNTGGREKGRKERKQASERSTSSGRFKRGSRTEFFLLI